MPSIQIDPFECGAGSGTTGLTLSVKVHNRSTLIATLTTTEISGEGVYVPANFTSPTNADRYTASLQDARGNSYGVVQAFSTDSAGNLLPTISIGYSQVAVASNASTVLGAISFLRGDTATISITGMGSLSGRTKLWFTVKNLATYKTDTDTAAIVQITEAGGLLILNGSAYGTSADGSLVVTDATAGNATITIKPSATAQLFTTADYVYDIQMINGSGVVSTVANGTFAVLADVTKAVS